MGHPAAVARGRGSTDRAAGHLAHRLADRSRHCAGLPLRPTTAAPRRHRPPATVARREVLNPAIAQWPERARGPVRGHRRALLHGARLSADDPGAGRPADRHQDLPALHFAHPLLDRRNRPVADLGSAPHREDRSAHSCGQRVPAALVGDSRSAERTLRHRNVPGRNRARAPGLPTRQREHVERVGERIERGRRIAGSVPELGILARNRPDRVDPDRRTLDVVRDRSGQQRCFARSASQL